MSLAKFKADLGNVTVGANGVKIVLTMSRKDFFKNAEFFQSDPEEIEVSLGDPQMTLEEYAQQQGLKPMTGTTYTVGSAGTVETKKEDGQTDLFDRQDDGAPFEVDGDVPADDAEEGDLTEEESDDGLEFDQPSEEEHGYTEVGGETDEVTAAAIDKEDLEQYILTERPIFDDIPYDFPALVERKRAGERWMDIAVSLGKTSGQVSTAYTEYKNKVKKQMAGAAS